MKQIGILTILLFNLYFAKAQSVQGTLMDPVEGVVVPEATVQLLKSNDSTAVENQIADKEGRFSFSKLSLGSYILKASSIGFETLEQTIRVTDSVPNVDLGDVYIPKKTTTLEGVVIIANAPAVSQKGDTTQFSASQYKVNPDATVEDLIKKMPGITVDKSGAVTAQGETVRKVTVDGKDFFGDDATMALRNLPSEVVDKIQVFDRMSDQAQLTGFDDGNSQKSINIVTRAGIRNGQFGRIYAGYGTQDRYQAGGNVSFFSGNRRLSFVGNFNNVNQQNFASQDLLGVTSSGNSGRGGGGRGGSSRGGGNSGNFTVGQNPGINMTNAFGINYGDKWGKKMDVTGSYFFNNSYNTNETETFRITTLKKDTTQYTQNNSYRTSNNNNHRFNLRMEYKIDSNNTIYIIPSLSFQNNQSASNGNSSSYNLYGSSPIADSVNRSINRSNGNREGYNISNNIMYRHSFAKRGRTFSLSFQTAFNKNDGFSYAYNNLRFFKNNLVTDSLIDQYRDNNSNGSNLSARAGFTEPVGKQGLFDFNYNYSVQHNKADQSTFDHDGNAYNDFLPDLSNKFNNIITTNSGEVNYRLGQSRDNQFSVGLNFQHSRLESERIFPNNSQVNQQFNTILPNLRWMRKIGTYGNLRVFYRARTDFPSIDQLQDVVDYSNPLNISSGNPALKQSYTNFGSARYSLVNTRTSRSFFANIFGQLTDNYITNATYIPTRDSVIEGGIELKRGSQFRRPINLNGFKNINSFLTYSQPIKFIKSNLNLNAGFSYGQIPGAINGKSTFTNTTVYSAGAVLGSNISEYIDFNVSYNASFNNSQSSANENNYRYVNQSAGFSMNLLTKNGWFIQNDLSNQSYSGLSEGNNESYWLWNAGVGKKFLKNKSGELKLSVFDLLKQNQSISRTVGDNFILDSRSQVLQQYFMLTFTYSLRNFGKGRTSTRTNSEERWHGGPPDGGRPGGGRPMF